MTTRPGSRAISGSSARVARKAFTEEDDALGFAV
jgi:hypothetical protein